MIKTVEQYSSIQNTKSYASLLWLFGQYLADNQRNEEAIRYLESGRDSFEMMKNVDKEYYQCLCKLGTCYLNYFEEDKARRSKYMDLARNISDILQKSRRRLGKSQTFAIRLRQRIEKYDFPRNIGDKIV